MRNLAGGLNSFSFLRLNQHSIPFIVFTFSANQKCGTRNVVCRTEWFSILNSEFRIPNSALS